MSTSPDTPVPIPPADKKPVRSIRWFEQPTNTRPWGQILITVGKQAQHYLIRELPTDFGFGLFGYELVKPEDRTCYHVLLDEQGGCHTCECLGFLRWNHCKHTEGLLALRGGA